MDNEAANSTRYCPGSRNVMVCAGIQNTGMVTPTISLMKRPQSIPGITSAKVTFSPEKRLSIYTSVMRCIAMNTGPNVKFMIAEMNNARRNLEMNCTTSGQVSLHSEISSP